MVRELIHIPYRTVEQYCDFAAAGMSVSPKSGTDVTPDPSPIQVLVLYEYLRTLGMEGELFWKKRLSKVVALFFINRYLNLGYYIYALIVQFLPLPVSEKNVSLRPSPPPGRVRMTY